MDEGSLQSAHEHSWRHRAEVEASTFCGCFYCLAVFLPQDIWEWIDDGTCAMCPRCSIDAVIGDASGLAVTDPSFLGEMQREFFSFLPDRALPLASKVVLHTPDGTKVDGFAERLRSFVQLSIADGVKFITCIGPDCERVHDQIDELLGGDGDNAVPILTGWQPAETVEDGLRLASLLSEEYGSMTQVVVL